MKPSESTFRSGHTPVQNQNDSKRKMIAFLENALRQQIEKRQQAQKMLVQYRQRSLKSQIQFSRVLQKYDNNIAIIRGKQSYSQQIWTKLINQIETFNDNSERILEKRCNEILHMMNRKITQILEKTDFQIKKTKKLSEEEYKTVKEQIKEALSLAREIEHQNDVIKKINKDLTFKVSVLREEKVLLIEELNQKKMLLQKMAKQHTIEKRPNSTTIMSPHPRSARDTSQYKPPKFMCEPSIRVSLDDPQKSSRVKSRNQMMAKTDHHFKLCLDRQKRKNTELKSMVTKLQNKYNEVTSFIDRAMRQKECKDPNENQRQLRGVIQAIKVKMMLPQNSVKNSMSQRQILQLLNY